MLVNDYQYETITRDRTLVDDLVIDAVLILILFYFTSFTLFIMDIDDFNMDMLIILSDMINCDKCRNEYAKYLYAHHI